MKKTFISISLVFFISACNSGTQNPPVSISDSPVTSPSPSSANKPKKIEDIFIQPTEKTFYYGESMTLSGMIRYSDGTSESNKINWISDNNNVLSIDSDADVRAESLGRATITAISEEDPGKSKSVEYSVKSRGKVYLTDSQSLKKSFSFNENKELIAAWLISPENKKYRVKARKFNKYLEPDFDVLDVSGELSYTWYNKQSIEENLKTAVNNQGDFVIAFADRQTMQINYYDSQGKKKWKQSIYSSQNKVFRSYDLSMDNDGNLAVFWIEENIIHDYYREPRYPTYMNAEVLDNNGRVITKKFEVMENQEELIFDLPKVILRNERIFLFWQKIYRSETNNLEYQNYYRIFDLLSEPVSDIINISQNRFTLLNNKQGILIISGNENNKIVLINFDNPSKVINAKNIEYKYIESLNESTINSTNNFIWGNFIYNPVTNYLYQYPDNLKAYILE